MSSPLTPDEELNSSIGNQSSEYEFDSSVSFEDKSMLTEQRKMESAIDRAIEVLNTRLQYYQEKGSKCENQLKELGLCIDDFPEDVKMDLKNVFDDGDGVFNFPEGQRALAEVNANYVVDSLQEKHELGELRLLASQMESMIEEYKCRQHNLQRKLNAQKEASDELDKKRIDKEVNQMIFRRKLEEATSELEHLQLSQGIQKPKYTLEDLKNLKEEIRKVESETASISVKLSKYNKLPLDDIGAKKLLDKMKEELKEVEDEIIKKLN